MGSTGGWNRSTANQPVKKGGAKAPSMWKCVAAGFFILVASCVFWLFLFVDKEKSSDPQAVSSRRIKTAVPSKSGRLREVPARRVVKKTGNKFNDALEEVAASGELVEADARPRKFIRGEIVKFPFNSGVEQLLCWVFSRELGDAPIPIPRITEEERANLAQILITKMAVNEDDSERTKIIKETIDYAKKEMAKYIGDGGDPDDFLQHYFQQLRVAFETREQARQQYYDMIDDDPELANAFAEKANELLSQKGIKPIEIEKPEEGQLQEEMKGET